MKSRNPDGHHEHALFGSQPFDWRRPTPPPAEQREVLGAIRLWSERLRTGRGHELTPLYAANAVRYEARTPIQSIGAERIGSAWESYLEQLPGRPIIETIDINCYAAPGTAIAHFLLKVSLDDAGPEEAQWLGVTQGYRVVDGVWRVVHEHVSESPAPVADRQWVIRGPVSDE